MESETVYIYGLWDPRDGRLRYIGKTINPKTRLHRHCVDYDRGKITHCSTWVKGIINDGLKPLMEILEETTKLEWQEVERDWIAKAKNFGLDLVNMNPGGTGGATPGRTVPPELREKISEKLKGRPSPAKGKRLSEDHKKRFLEGRRNRTLYPKLSEEHKAKIGAANSKALKGRKISEAEKERLRQVAVIRRQREGEREEQKQRTSNRQRDKKGRLLPHKSNQELPDE